MGGRYRLLGFLYIARAIAIAIAIAIGGRYRLLGFIFLKRKRGKMLTFTVIDWALIDLVGVLVD